MLCVGQSAKLFMCSASIVTDEIFVITPREQLQSVVLKYLDDLQESGTSGESPQFPEFDYYAADYLDFAEMNLQQFDIQVDQRRKENELICCVSNLKRALDCQLECFLHAWQLRDVTRKRNLGLDKKLKFLADVGVFSSRTITRFSVLRNKLEHDFQRPNVADLEALYDLVTAFVSILQSVIVMRLSSECEMSIYNGLGNEIGSFSITYVGIQQCFYVTWEVSESDIGEVSADINSPQDFAYFFRVWYLLSNREGYGSLEHIRTKLRI